MDATIQYPQIGNDAQTSSDDIEDRIESVAVEFLEQLRAGNAPAISTVVAAHPDFGTRLLRRLTIVEQLFRIGRTAKLALHSSETWQPTACAPTPPDGHRELISNPPPHRANDSVNLPSTIASGTTLCTNCGAVVPTMSGRPSHATCWQCGNTLLADTAVPEMPTVEVRARSIGRFRLVERVGRGGFGDVFRAWDTQLQRVVAVKISRINPVAQPEMYERFLREGRAVARLKHPHIVAIHEFGRVDGSAYLVSEFINGPTLAELATRREINFQESARILAQIADALDAAHNTSMLHRDVKPSNILINEHGQAFLTDFGLAHHVDDTTLTVAGQILGTIQYMSPEQAGGHNEQLDRRTDVYSLGVVMYWLLTRTSPFVGTRSAILSQIISDVPRPPRRINEQIPPDLEVICRRAMTREPANRYATAGMFADDLRRWLDGVPIQARPVGAVERAQSWVRRHRLVAGLAAAVAGLVLAGVVATPVWAFRERSLRAQATDAARESRDRLAQMFTGRGLNELEKGDSIAALGWFAHSLRLTDENATRNVADRTRIASILRSTPTLARLYTHEPNRVLRHLAISDDDQRLLTASDDGTAQVLGLHSGKPLPGDGLRHARGVNHIEQSRDGGVIATAGNDGAARLWDGRTGALLHTLRHREGCLVEFLTFSPDQRVIATVGGTYDPSGPFGEARLWDVATGQPIGAPLLHEGKIESASFSADGNWLATGGSLTILGGIARVWNVADGTQVGNAIERSGRITSVQFSPQRQQLLTASFDGTAVVWELDAERRTWTVRALAQHEAEVWVARFGQDGHSVLTACFDGAAHLWDVRGEAAVPVLRFPHADRVLDARFSSDGAWITTASSDGSGRVWEAVTGRPVTPPLHHAHEVSHCVLARDRRSVVTGATDGAIKIWDLAAAAASLYWTGDAVTHFDIRSDSARVAVADHSGGVRTFDLASENLVDAANHADVATGVAFSSDGRRVASVSRNGEILVRDQSGHVLLRRRDRRLTGVAWNSDATRLVTRSVLGTVKEWDAATGTELHAYSHVGPVSFARFDPRQNRLLTTGGDNLAALRESGATTREIRHDSPVPVAAWSPDGRQFATASGGHVWIRDAATGNLVTELKQESAVDALQFSREGRSLVLGALDGSVRICDAATGKRITPIIWQPGRRIRSAEFSPDGRWVVTASNPVAPRRDRSNVGECRVWDAQTGQAVTPSYCHAGPIDRASFLPNGLGVASAGSDGTIRIWPFEPDVRPASELIALAELQSGHRIDAAGTLVPLELGEMQSLLGRPQQSSAKQCDAWELGQAVRFANLGRWEDAALSLSRLSAESASRTPLLLQRASAAAELGRWDAAIRDFGQVRNALPSDARVWASLALSKLGAGDIDGYRDLAAEMLRITRQQYDGSWASQTLLVCSIDPRPDDAAAVLALAERFRQEEPDHSRLAFLQGAASFRAGQTHVAVRLLTPIAKRPSDPDARVARLILALATARSAAGDAVTQWSSPAGLRARETASPPTRWQDRLIEQHVSQELAALLADN